MQIRSPQLAQALKATPPWVIVFGDDPLLVEEALDKVRQHARHWGSEERLRLVADGQFDWHQLLDDYQSLSLFASRRLIEVQLQQKPNDTGKAILSQLLTNPNPDVLLLLHGPRAEKSLSNAAWFKAMSSQGLYLPIYPLADHEFPGWLAHRLQQAGFQASPQALQALAQFTEGNLLAAVQEVEKLTLIYPAGALDEQQVAAAVLDHARFDLFQWTDTLLGNDANKALRVLARVLEEGIEPPLLLWALGREVDTLLALTTTGDPQRELAKRRLPPQRKKHYLNAINKLSPGRLRQIGRHLAWLDQHFKRHDDGLIEQGFADLTLAFFPGQRPPLPVIRPEYDA